MLRIDNIKLKPGYSKKDLEDSIKKVLKKVEYKDYKILRRSLDARKKDDIIYLLSIGVNIKGNEEKCIKMINNKNVMLIKEKKYRFPYSMNQFSLRDKLSEDLRPVIIGAGPAGYFAAQILAENGFRPIVIERGKNVTDRKKDVEAFWAGEKLNNDSNVSFGEGGAGTFSDGKLNTGNKDKFGIFAHIMNAFHRFGADEAVTYDAKPHIGTDRLILIMENIREDILKNGGDIRFGHKLINIEEADDQKDSNKIYDLEISDGKDIYKLRTRNVILSIGHSARDTFEMLYNKGFSMEQKPFAVGLRIEHPRKNIDRAQYGDKYMDKLPAADYKMTYHATNGRSVFSFCMCPGGYVVNASTEDKRTVVNGMSYSGRDGDNSNAAIVVNILPEDIAGNDPLDAVEFQRRLEEKFYEAGNGNIPVQRFEDFSVGRKTEKLGTVMPAIKGKYVLSELKSCLPEYVSDAIIEGIKSFGTKLHGFDNNDAILSGIESRTSSPVRICRDENLMMNDHPGIFPCGEGAGYAGGITSAAADGIKCAEKVAQRIITNLNFQEI